MNRKIRLGFVSSHPIQYHSPWFRAIAEQPIFDLEVLYCHNPSPDEQGNAGFGVPFSWDMPLLGGYKHRFLTNVSQKAYLGGFRGIDTPELWDAIRRERYDAVVVNGWHYKSAWQAIRACWRSGVPVLVRSDSHLHTARHPLKKALKAVPYRWFVPRLDACLAVGSWSTDYFLHYGASRERVFIVPHAVDPALENRARELTVRRPDLRKAWGFAADQVVFLFAGKFIGKKRPLDFIRAIHLARQRDARVCGLMVGDGPLRAECERQATALDLPIRFAGFLNQSEIVQAYVASDTLVLPSDGEETWGLVVNEAMTCGRPCLVSDHVGCGPDLVSRGETGDIFPLGDVEAAARQMAEYASRKETLIAMGESARARIAKHSVSAASNHLFSMLSPGC